MFKTIVVGTDGSPTADRAVDAALEVARSLDAKVHVVSAYKPLNAREIEERKRGLQPRAQVEVDDAYDARELLARMEKVVANAGVEGEFHAREGDAADAIIEVAREVDADAIVVGNKGMSGLKGRLLGSVPDNVAHHAPCSVVIVRTS